MNIFNFDAVTVAGSQSTFMRPFQLSIWHSQKSTPVISLVENIVSPIYDRLCWNKHRRYVDHIEFWMVVINLWLISLSMWVKYEFDEFALRIYIWWLVLFKPIQPWWLVKLEGSWWYWWLTQHVTIDQEAVGAKLINGRYSIVRSLSGFAQPERKTSNGFYWPGP